MFSLLSHPKFGAGNRATTRHGRRHQETVIMYQFTVIFRNGSFTFLQAGSFTEALCILGDEAMVRSVIRSPIVASPFHVLH